jgi:hypothetical protein
MDKTKKSFSHGAKTFNKDIYWQDNNALKNIDLTGKEVYVIGDIHGCLHTLRNLISKIGFDMSNLPENVVLISVGDIHDKGEYSVEVLKWAMEQSSLGKLIVVDSNHGRALTRKIGKPHRKFKESIEYTYKQLIEDEQPGLIKRVNTFLKNRPVYLDANTDNGRLVVAHACALERVIGKNKLTPAEVRYFMLAREAVWSGQGTCIVGHVRFPEPVVVNNNNGGKLIRIDTGCAEQNGSLTILHFNSDTFTSVTVDHRDLTGYSSGEVVDELDDEEV